MKKLIAILLSCMMLVSFSPAVAAEDAPAEPKPSVEAILNDFHQKAFAAESADEQNTAEAYSRNTSSDNDSLVQETVDTLNAAGYEAYNVTSSNYEALETELKTDFASMGLDPNGSYIVVISGEDYNNTSNPNARFGRLPEENIIDDGVGAPTSFKYTYDGTTYIMRYVTVTPLDSNLPLTLDFNFDVDRTDNSSNWDSILNAAIGIVVDQVLDDYALIAPVANAAVNKLLGISATVHNFSGFTIDGATSWVLQFIEVYDSANDSWHPSQRSEYAISTLVPEVWVFNPSLQKNDKILGTEITFRTDSELYNDLESRKRIAAECFPSRMLDAEDTGDIVFCVKDPFSGTQFYINGSYTFVQPHWIWSYDP